MHSRAHASTTAHASRVGVATRATAAARGKVAVITGANTGIGLETARGLYLDDSHRFSEIILACRDEHKARRAIDAIVAANPDASNRPRLTFEQVDLGSLSSCEDFGKRFLDERGADASLDALICNAGVMACPSLIETSDGFEYQVGVNHLGHYALVASVWPALAATAKTTGDGRVVVVSSEAHRIPGNAGMNRADLFGREKYSAWGQYGQSKLANVLFAFELARRAEGTGVSACALHPGAVDTELGRYLQPEGEPKWWQKALYDVIRTNFLKTPAQGAETSLYLARDVAHGAEMNGKYFADCKEKTPSKACFNREDALWLWERSAELTGARFDV
jgi:NAD(P)-dependent dehydrogenase (short-subunit alcohol dehydrogenase family)